MTGLSPAAFHARDGVGEWRVTSRGAEAVFRAVSLAHAARLVPLVVDHAVDAGVAPDLDVRPEAVAVRIPWVEGALPDGAPGFAAAISGAARDLGLTAAPHDIQVLDIFVAEHEDAPTRPFWRAALGYREEGEVDVVDPLRRNPQLAVNPIGNGKQGRGRTHLDLFLPADVARERVEAALAAGGRLVDDSHAPAFWTIASPDNHGVDIAAWVDTWDGS